MRYALFMLAIFSGDLALAQLAFAGFQLLSVDFWFQQLLPTPAAHSAAAYMSALLVSIAFTAYTRASLDTAANLRGVHRLLTGAMILYGIVLLLAPMLDHATMLLLVAPLGVLMPASLLVTVRSCAPPAVP